MRDDDGLRERVTRHFPKLGFWYGLSFSELTEMPLWAVEAYAEELPRLLASYELLLARAATHPHLRPQTARRNAQQLKRAAESGRRTNRETLPRERLAEMLPKIGIGVVGNDAG